VEGEGFEPSKAEPADLQSAPFDRSGTPPTKPAILAISIPKCQTAATCAGRKATFRPRNRRRLAKLCVFDAFPRRSKPGLRVQAMALATADYVIVGAGSAGCALAHRLSADGRHAVLLLEAGPRDVYPWLHIPIGYAKTMFNPRVNWCFYTEPEPGMNGRRIYWPQGKTLGGSSAINGLIAVRGQAQDYERWAAEGNPGWGFGDVLPYFKRLEHAPEGDPAFHGRGGPVWCSRIPRKHELIEAVIAGCAEIGIPRNEDFNAATQEGAGYYQLTTRRGWRCSTASAYLKPARGRANLRVETE